MVKNRKKLARTVRAFECTRKRISGARITVKIRSRLAFFGNFFILFKSPVLVYYPVRISEFSYLFQVIYVIEIYLDPGWGTRGPLVYHLRIFGKCIGIQTFWKSALLDEVIAQYKDYVNVQ